MKYNKINPEKQRQLFDTALLEKDHEEALHIISRVQDDGRFPRLVFHMTRRLDLAEALDARTRDAMELDYEKLQTLRAITV